MMRDGLSPTRTQGPRHCSGSVHRPIRGITRTRLAEQTLPSGVRLPIVLAGCSELSSERAANRVIDEQ
jgi:hypothetical protein